MPDASASVALKVSSIDAKSYAPFGDVIEVPPGAAGVPTNQGTARRFNHLGTLVNHRGASASPNLCIFRCDPRSGPEIEFSLLERHRHSTQLFVPLALGRRYLAIVALGEKDPDLSTARAFLVESPVGITYHPGVWHHPMIALDSACEFLCLVWENGAPDDCETRPLAVTLKAFVANTGS